MFYMSFSQEDGILFMKVKEFFQTVWYYLTYPCQRIRTRRVDKILREAAAEDRAAVINENDVEFFKSIGIETDLETLKNGGKPEQKSK